VVLPDALPDLFTTVRLSIGIGWTSLIAAEMVAASSGLGWMVINASSYLRTDIVMLGILLLGGTGYLLDLSCWDCNACLSRGRGKNNECHCA
jgi:taurine transport system permease protein